MVSQPRFLGKDIGGLARGGEAEHRPVVVVELGDGAGDGAGLAAAGRSDHEHCLAVASDAGFGGELQVPVESVGPAGVAAGPVLQAGLLVEDLGAGVAAVDDVLDHWSSIPTNPGGRVRGTDLDASFLGVEGELVDPSHRLVGGPPVVGEQGGDVAGEVGSQPRRRLVRDPRNSLIRNLDIGELDGARAGSVEAVGHQLVEVEADGPSLV
jgi:hypothetical protein